MTCRCDDDGAHRTDRERVNLLLDELSIHCEVFRLLHQESGTDLPFQDWFDLLTLRM